MQCKKQSDVHIGPISVVWLFTAVGKDSMQCSSGQQVILLLCVSVRTDPRLSFTVLLCRLMCDRPMSLHPSAFFHRSVSVNY